MHEMRLNNEPFELIKSGKKTIEMRLYDEKRRLIKIHDKIKFINRKDQTEIVTEVISLNTYDSFQELYKHYSKISLGYKEDEISNPSDMNKYYNEEDIRKYGVVAIEIKLV